MEQTDPANPHLVDIFKTLLSQCQPEGDSTCPRGIVVNGNRNVIVFGGNVYLGAQHKPAPKVLE